MRKEPVICSIANIEIFNYEMNENIYYMINVVKKFIAYIDYFC